MPHESRAPNLPVQPRTVQPPQVRSWVITLATLVGLSAARSQTIEPTPGPEAGDIWIAGRVVDDEGRPVPDVQVRGSSPLFTDDLEWAFQWASRTSTDAHGRFTIPVPYADMRYSIAAEKIGWSNQWVKVLAGSTQPLEIKIKKGRHHRALGGQVVVKAGEPVAGIQVKLIAEYGFARETLKNRATGTSRRASRGSPGDTPPPGKTALPDAPG